MTSAQPPVLKPSLGTPSNEWAKKITSSLDPPSQETPQDTTSGQATTQSPGVTPGSELPGAFPNRGQGETSTGTTNITESIVDTAKFYLPISVVNTVENFLGGNNNSTGTTGPDNEVRASEHDVSHKTSLPSQELRGALPSEHVGGVGSLPGASIEKSVALLPDEQAEWSEWNTFAGRNTPGYQTPSDLQGKATVLSQTVTQKATNLGVAAGVTKADVPPKQTTEDIDKSDVPPEQTTKDIGKSDTLPKQATEDISKPDVPPEQTTEVTGKSDAPARQTTEDTDKPGVPPKQMTEDVGKGYPETLTSGDIAGARQAVGNIKPVAFDIKQAQDVSMPSTETRGQQPGQHANGIGSLPGSKDEQGVAVLPEERATKTTEMVRPEDRKESDDLPDQTNKSTGLGGVGVGGATDPLRKDTQSRDPPTEPPAPEPKVAGSEPGQPRSAPNEPENLTSIQRSGGSEGSGEGQRKASLKEKISGGMKVVSGKLGHDKSKVEEGRKLMHGQTA